LTLMTRRHYFITLIVQNEDKNFRTTEKRSGALPPISCDAPWSNFLNFPTTKVKIFKFFRIQTCSKTQINTSFFSLRREQNRPDHCSNGLERLSQLIVFSLLVEPQNYYY